jgi:hypothetical protein
LLIELVRLLGLAAWITWAGIGLWMVLSGRRPFAFDGERSWPPWTLRLSGLAAMLFAILFLVHYRTAGLDGVDPTGTVVVVSGLVAMQLYVRWRTTARTANPKR